MMMDVVNEPALNAIFSFSPSVGSANSSNGKMVARTEGRCLGPGRSDATTRRHRQSESFVAQVTFDRRGVETAVGRKDEQPVNGVGFDDQAPWRRSSAVRRGPGPTPRKCASARDSSRRTTHRRNGEASGLPQGRRAGHRGASSPCAPTTVRTVAGSQIVAAM